jgi:hypothetical protein
MPPPEPNRIFISYARQDAANLAQRLQADLTEKGLTPVVSEAVSESAAPNRAIEPSSSNLMVFPKEKRASIESECNVGQSLLELEARMVLCKSFVE